jgi:serpin B
MCGREDTMHQTRRELIIGALFALATGARPALALAAPADARSARLIAAYDGLGQRLFKEFANKPRNVVFSPYSIGIALAMALTGARGTTAVEMARVLGLDLSPDEVDAANAAVQAGLNKSPSSLQLHLANALVLTNKPGAMSEDYVATLRKDYAAEVFRGGNLATVNAWVKQQTDGKIDSILKQLDPKTIMVLIDAIYFKATWQSTFATSATADATFHLSDGTTAKVPMMYQQDDFALAGMPGYSAIRLPYEGARASMIVILPDAGIASVMQRLNGEELQHLLAWFRNAPEQPIALSLPRFRTRFLADLVEPLQELGMHRAFDPQKADFSGITGKLQSRAPLAINQIVHAAVIDVTEQGTEAAAATSEGLVAAAIEVAHWQPFRVDKPFLFAVVDDETNAILFEGLIADPRQVS